MTALEVRNRLGARIGSRLPATVPFDYPTVGRLADHLLETVLLPGSAARPSAPVPQAPVAAAAAWLAAATGANEPIAVVSLACLLPGVADDPDRLWPLLAAGHDPDRPVPGQPLGRSGPL